MKATMQQGVCVWLNVYKWIDYVIKYDKSKCYSIYSDKFRLYIVMYEL